MTELRVGLLGCGVVGQGVVRLVRESARLIEARLGHSVKIQRIYLRQDSRSLPNVPSELVTHDPALIEAYRDYLPVLPGTPVVTLHEGNTPLLEAPRLAREITGGDTLRLFLKY